MNCRNCGKRKDGKVRDRVPEPESAATVTDPQMLREARAGKNWTCEYCGSQTRNLDGKCWTCAGEKPDPFRPGVFVSSPPDLGSDPRPSESAGHGMPFRSPRQELPEAVLLRRTPWWKQRVTWAVAAGAVGLGLLVWLIVWLATPRRIDAKVDRIGWSYVENLRERETRHSAEWGRPGGKGFYNEPAFNVSCERRYYGQERCRPHDCNPHRVSYQCRPHDCNCRETCSDNGNGYSTCRTTCSTCYDTCYRTEYDTCYDSCPVYKQWCEYDYHEWPIKKTEVTSGDSHKVKWPGMVAPVTGPDDRYRVERVEVYDVKFVHERETLYYRPKNLADYRRFFVGDTWRLKIAKVTGTVSPEKLLKSAHAEKPEQ